MRNQNYTATILVQQSPQEVFDAINDVRSWWSHEIEGRSDVLGAVFRFRYKDLYRSTQTITEFTPAEKVVWRISDAQLNFVNDKSEWKGTEIVFRIAKKAGKTELRFTHVGLVPACECYDECSGAWDFFIKDCLRSFIVWGRAEAA